MVTADKLILEWDTLLASSNCLWEIETQAIQMIKWSTNGGRSLFGTKMQGPTAAFEHGIQSDGSLLADDAAQDKMDAKNVKPPSQAELKHEMSTKLAWWCFLDKTTSNIENQEGKHAKWHDDARGDTRHGARRSIRQHLA
jgi:hypothetical protein